MQHLTEEELDKYIKSLDLPKIGTIWRHYKGGLYIVRENALNEATQRMGVVYQDLTPPCRVYSRPFDDWRESVYHEGKIVRRFTMVTNIQ